MDTEYRGGKRPNEAGPWGRRVAANVIDLRERARMTQGMLAERVQELGRPMTRLMVSRVEQGTRRIDVDDLAAFSLALGCAPNRLLLPGTADGEEVIEVSSGRHVTELDAWEWALGERPLDGETDAKEFVAENRPSRAAEMALADKLSDNPELVRAITRTATQARKAGVSIPELYLATALAYLTHGGA